MQAFLLEESEKERIHWKTKEINSNFRLNVLAENQRGN